MGTKSYWQQFQRQRISRRRLLATAGTGAAGLAVFAACTDDKKTTGGVTPGPDGGGEPQVGGKYIYAITGDWGTIDPLTSVAFGPGIFGDIYNCLLDRSRIKPEFFYFDLAESYETPDDSTYVFTIRPGVKIAPNTLGIPERDMDASDAKAWLDRVTADTAAVERAFTNLWLDSYEASADGKTFTIKTKGPYAYFLFRIGPVLGGCIPPKEFYEQSIDIKGQGVGAGPYSIVAGSYSNTGGIVLQRNPNYYRKDAEGRQLPFLNEKEAVRISDRQPRRTAFIDKQIHTYTAENRDEVDQLESEISDLLVTEESANTFIAFTMNPEKAPWDDEKIRKAAMFALNRQQYVDLIVGSEFGQTNGLVHWPLQEALPPEELATLQPFDPEMSKQLINEATGNDRITIKVIYPVSDIEFHDKHLPIWRQQMNAAGFDLDEDPQDFTTWVSNYATLNYDSSLSLNQIYETAEIPVDFHAAKGPQGDRAFAIGIGGLYPEIEAAITASKVATNPAEHVRLVQEVQRMIYDKGPSFLPIMTWTSFDLYHPFVKNVPQGYGAGTRQYLENEYWLDQSLI